MLVVQEDFLDNFDPDEVIYIDNFDITDVYLYSTYKDFEIIEVNIVEGIAPEWRLNWKRTFVRSSPIMAARLCSAA